MSRTRNHIQFVFPKHESGRLAHHPNLPPSTGLLILANHIYRELGWTVEVFDANIRPEQNDDFLDQVNAEFVGFSVWFSNYENAIRQAKQVKIKNPDSIIVFGGPHVSSLANQILKNNEFIDFAIMGDGEHAMVELLMGRKEFEEIEGLCYRKESKVLTNPRGQGLSLDLIPPPNLSLLKSPWEWGIHSDDSETDMSAFPLSGVRGCARKKRCEYCSIPTIGVRSINPSLYIDQIVTLFERDGINMFFETGDIFPKQFAKKLAEQYPSHLAEEVSLKIYSYPGMITQEYVRNLVKIGVSKVFIGVENLLIWERKSFARKYGASYTCESLLAEIRLLAAHGIRVMPSFILGVPGETDISLQRNKKYIESIVELDNVTEFLVNYVFPLPGSKYFEWCVNDEEITLAYNHITGDILSEIDNIDYDLLSKLFVERYSNVSFDAVLGVINELANLQKSSSQWGKDAISDYN